MLRRTAVSAARRRAAPVAAGGAVARHAARAVAARAVVTVAAARGAPAAPKTAWRQVPARRGMASSTVEVPSLGDSITEGTVVELSKAVGDFVDVDEVVAVLETDKVSVDIRSTVAGTVKAYFADDGDTVEVGQKLVEIEAGGERPAAAAPPAKEEAAPAKEAAPAAPAKEAAPAKTEAPKQQQQQQQKQQQQTTTAPPAKAAGARNESRVKMSRMRQRIAERLKDAQNTNAMLTTFNEIDMSNLMAMRSKYKDEFTERHGVKLGFMSAFAKASASALQTYPDVNAVIDGKDVVYRDYVDISVAVSTPTGLVVPVLRNVEEMSFAGVESAIGDLGRRARDGQIALEDMQGGTFTISNGGVYGSLFGTPIINPPQSAILGMHGIFKRPVAVDGKVEIRPMMYVALTYDHRLIDGSGAVTFLRKIKDLVEDPQRMLLDL